MAISALTFELVPNWEHIPEGWSHGDVAGVATDSHDRVYVFNRSEHPVIVYDANGAFLSSWGEGVFTRPHGITIHKDVVYCADDTDHTVRVLTLDGQILHTLGNLNQPSDSGYSPEGRTNLLSIKRGAAPFNRPTRLSVSPSTGELYVSDGYGNARIHRFSPDGKLIQSWGEPGTEAGQFNLPHSVWAHTDGRVFVCDRENDRIQIFTSDGKFLSMWTNVIRPGDLFIDGDNNVYVGEMSHAAGSTSMAGRPLTETHAAKMTVRDLDGNVVSQWGGPEPCADGSFSSPHGLWVDSHGDLYVGEVTQTYLTGAGQWQPGCHSLQKFTRRA